jgi:hypothetical protein
MLQSEAGYIDARPHIRQIDEIFLQRTAGPYIRVKSGAITGAPAYSLSAMLRKPHKQGLEQGRGGLGLEAQALSSRI